MSNYFGGFSLNKLTNSITSVAHKTQDTLSTAIANIQLDDPQAKLSLKARKHYLQETLGTIEDISKLPPQYQFLEKKCDSLEKVCRRMLVVTKTYEVEGYDYPPNLSESLSDWWSSNKEGLLGFVSSSKKEKKPEPVEDSKDALMPRSFAQAISKAAKDSGEAMAALKAEEQKASAEEDEEDEDITSLIKMFEAWSTCQHNMDQSKAEMDTLMVKEFNHKLTTFIEEKFKNARALRKKVEDSRLKFDTMRYELKMVEQQGKSEETTQQTEEATQQAESQKPQEEEVEVSKGTDSSDGSDEAQKLLEKLEDEFVSNTTEAVETMGEITDSAEIINLVKLFHNFQLIYYKQCVQNLETSLNSLNELESDEA
ncbi:LAQU0S04e02608g1_1 [Lachancea quebecensis]|uniref:LAQU0S04e02608g1_1 n=1 Tax=Lachancea quebecensis TaxID=1654605 RepID=A0A0P1KQC7_9SACH|nr:LAQU0S04e02608g1_1 [Lachancea quebecensis]